VYRPHKQRIKLSAAMAQSHQSSNKLTELVTDLAVKLEKACEPARLDAALAGDVLGELETIDMTVDILKKSKAGFAVKKCKAVKADGAFASVCERASLLFKKWKRAVATPSDPTRGGEKATNGRPSESLSTASVNSGPATSISPLTCGGSQGKARNGEPVVEGNAPPPSSGPSTSRPPPLPTQSAADPPSVLSHLTSAEAAILEDSLPPSRLKIANLFLALFLKYPEGQEDPGRAARVAVDIEQAMQNAMDHKLAAKQYGDKARSLKYNLGMNEHLRMRVILSDVAPAVLVAMKADEMQPEEHRQAAEAAAALAYEANLLDWHDKNADKIRKQLGIEDVGGSFTCGRCKGNKTSYQAKQTRSSDEPMTMFVRCLTCGNRWKE